MTPDFGDSENAEGKTQVTDPLGAFRGCFLVGVPQLLTVMALALAGLGQASLAGARFPRWLTAPYPFVAGLLLLILATWPPRRPTTTSLRRWLGGAVGLAVALLCAVLAVHQFRQSEGFAVGLILSGLSIAVVGAVLGNGMTSPPDDTSRGFGQGSHEWRPPEGSTPVTSRLALTDGGRGLSRLTGWAEVIVLMLAAVAMAVAIFLWWKEEKPNLALVLNAAAFLCILWIARRLDRRSTTPTHNPQSPILRPGSVQVSNLQSPIPNQKSEWLVLALILIAATILRTHRLLEMPYGVWYDEGEAGIEAVRIYEGVPFSPMGYYSPNNPSLFFYLTAIGFKLLGPDLWTLRLVTAAIGVATVAAAYFLFRLMFGRRAALIAAGLLAASSWHVNFSRIGMGYATLVPFFETMTLYFLVRGLSAPITRSRGFSRWNPESQPPEGSTPEVIGSSGGRWTDFVLSGLMLGLGMYGHTSLRVFPLVVVIYVLYVLVWQRHLQWRFTGPLVAVVVSLMVFAPLGVWAARHPDAFFGRTAQTSFLVGHDTLQSKVRALKGNVEKHALMFNLRGDRNGRHNLPGAPQLDAVSAALFALGAGYCLYRWRSPSHFLLSAWFAVAMLAGVLSLDWEAPQAARAIGAIPAVYGMAAVPLALAWGQIASAGPSRSLRGWRTAFAIIPTLVVAILLLAVFRLNYDRYFNQQQQNAEVFHAFSTPDTAIARYVQAVGEDDYRFYLQNQFTPVYRFLTYHLGEGSDRHEIFFQAVDHLPVRGAVDRDVMYVLEPWRVALPIEAFRRYYPRGVYEVVTDPFGKPMFYSYTVDQSDVGALAGLTGRYSSVGEVVDSPELTRHDPNIDFDWVVSSPTGEASPLGEGPLNVRWEGALFAPESGTYALGTRSGGRSQVLLDGDLVVDNAGAVESRPGWAEGVRPLAKGWHGLVVTCHDCGGGVMQLYWSPADGEAGIVPTEALSTVAPLEHGLRGDYYVGAEPIGLPLFTQIDPLISFRWHDDPIPTPWSGQWSGWLDVEEAGEHQFQIFSNDQAWLYLDDEPVVGGSGRLYGSARLDVGPHAIRVTYSNKQFYSELRLLWIPPGGDTWETIPTERLRPDSVSPNRDHQSARRDGR